MSPVTSRESSRGNNPRYALCFILALFKSSQDAAVYYNQLEQYPERRGKKTFEENNYYISICIFFAIMLFLATQKSFAHFIYKIFFDSHSLENEGSWCIVKSLVIITKFLAAIMKSAVKATSMQLQLYLTDDSTWGIESTLILSVFFILLLLCEFALFKKDTPLRTCCSLKSIKLLTFFLAGFYAFATACTYATSLRGFPKHIEVRISKEVENAIKIISNVFTVILTVSTRRFIHDKLINKFRQDNSESSQVCFYECMLPQTPAIKLTKLEIFISTLWKTSVSATSLAALLYSICKFEKTKLSPSNIFIIIGVSTVFSLLSQMAGLTPPSIGRHKVFNGCTFSRNPTLLSRQAMRVFYCCRSAPTQDLTEILIEPPTPGT